MPRPKKTHSRELLAVGGIAAVLVALFIWRTQLGGRLGRLGPELDRPQLTDEERASPFHVKAQYWTPLGAERVRCDLCPHACQLRHGERGTCKARYNHHGELFSMIHGKTFPMFGPPTDLPIIFHGLRRPWLRLGLVGCGMRCSFCFAEKSALADPRQVNVMHMSAKDIVDLAIQKNSTAIVHTTNEPTVNIEYLLEVSKEARSRGLLNLLTTSGFVSPGPLTDLAQHLDGVVVSIKGFREEMYRKHTSGSLKVVLENILLLKQLGQQVSIIYTVIPTISDSDAELRAMAAWIHKHLGQYTELFLLRFYPSYKLKNLPPTPMATLLKARRIAREAGLKLAMLYLPDIYKYDDPADLRNAAVACPFCGKELMGYTVKDGVPTLNQNLDGNRCGSCGRDIPWSRGRFLKLEQAR